MQLRGDISLTVSPIEDVKAGAWYYGIQCACARLLAVCEDHFGGKGTELTLPIHFNLAVRCGCGEVTSASVLKKFQLPP